MNGSIKKEMLFFKEQGFFETPKICQIEITTVCPLKCPQCYKSLTPKHANFEALCKRLEEAKKAGVGSIMINGGEPMMHPYFLKLISYISDKLLLDVYCFLSGYGITENVAKKLDNKKVHITFSLNGSIQEINDKSRDGYDYAVNAFQIFKGLSIPCGINWVGRKDNVGDFENLIKFAEENGVKWINVISNKLSCGEIKSAMAYEDYQYLSEVIKKYRNKGKVDIQIEGCNSLLNYFLYQKKLPITFNGCQAGRMVYFIDIDGNYMPCSHLQYKEKFSDIISYWKRSKVLHMLRQSNGMEKCSGCKYAAHCFVCKASSQETHDDFFACNKACVLRKEIEDEEHY